MPYYIGDLKRGPKNGPYFRELPIFIHPQLILYVHAHSRNVVFRFNTEIVVYIPYKGRVGPIQTPKF